jgi:hypothetical protein
MPFPGGVFTSSSAGDIGGGTPYSQIRNFLLVGDLGGQPPASGSQTGSGVGVKQAGISCIQSTVNLTTIAGQQLTTATGAAYFYIAQTTAQVVTSSAAQPGPGGIYPTLGAALLYDSTRKKLCIFSTVQNEWVGIAVATST